MATSCSHSLENQKLRAERRNRFWARRAGTPWRRQERNPPRGIAAGVAGGDPGSL